MQNQINRLANLIIQDIRDEAMCHGSSYNEAVAYLSAKKEKLHANYKDNPVYGVQIDLIINAIQELKKEAMQLPLKNIKN
ncbi:hypothetical protein JYG89_01030 [Latilactobacillus curvatus]|uniref:hypothetical protein n=1 Tax=Latilactobacillus curvatus TaxID=28038 RepID=UPI001CBB5DB7|nr:hypothetical protein [Latilactobacillus curvatus]MBZ1504016.1 hypothetical protein [Latilactobacillus curvatus]